MTEDRETATSSADPPAVKALTLGEAALLLQTYQLATTALSLASEVEAAEGDGFGPRLEECGRA